jgi:uncharacterized protein (TIGR02118 family)
VVPTLKNWQGKSRQPVKIRPDPKETKMVKLTALYRKPANPSEFDRYYENVHKPLALKMPGLRKMAIAKVKSGIVGESPYYMFADMYFENVTALQSALASPEGRTAAKDVGNFAKDIIELLVAEVEEKELAAIV